MKRDDVHVLLLSQQNDCKMIQRALHDLYGTYPQVVCSSVARPSSSAEPVYNADSPKSLIFRFALRSSSRFSGLRSRWQTPATDKKKRSREIKIKLLALSHAPERVDTMHCNDDSNKLRRPRRHTLAVAVLYALDELAKVVPGRVFIEAASRNSETRGVKL